MKKVQGCGIIKYMILLQSIQEFQMKKATFFVIFICLAAVLTFAESYTVQNVTGRVEREIGGNGAAAARAIIKTGEMLDGETVIYTGIGSSIVLKDKGEKTTAVPAARNGKVSDLVKAATGVRISSNIARTDTSAVGRSNAQIGTASARASEAAGDWNIAAE